MDWKLDPSQPRNTHHLGTERIHSFLLWHLLLFVGVICRDMEGGGVFSLCFLTAKVCSLDRL